MSIARKLGGGPLGAAWGVLMRLHNAYSGLFFDALSFVVCILPLDVALELGRAVGTVGYCVWGSRRRVALENLRASLPEAARSSERARAIALAAFQNAGRSFVEILRFSRLTREDLARTITFENACYVEQARDRGKGVFGLSAHIGNFELIAGTLTQLLDLPCSLVARKVENDAFQERWLALRRAIGSETIASKQSVREILRRIKRGEGVGMVLDQHLSERRGGLPVDFFGRPAYTIGALAALQRKTDAWVLPLFMVREPRQSRHRMIIFPPIDYERPTGDDALDDLHNTQRYSRAIEEVVRRHPEQWFWFHRRWRPPREERERD